MEDLFVTIWFVVGLLIVIGSIIHSAWEKQPDPMGDFFGAVMFAITWPLIFAIALIGVPFVGLYLLVSWIHDLYEERHE